MEQRNARESEYLRKSNEADASGKPLEVTQFQATGAFVQASIVRLRSEKERGVTSYWLLHRVGEWQQVAAVEFDAVGDSLRGSLVLAESGRLSSFAIARQGICMGTGRSTASGPPPPASISQRAPLFRQRT